ncbi:MAG TPA: TIGR03936 family radical SAM-associated protein [Clostridia bacterium]|nr:TIGR03936 family radical SAM-associated protein [Clostridia bacterium]
MQRLFGRAFRRAGTPVCYSQGFNPHPVLAFATALSTGTTSDAEWLDIHLERDMPCREFAEALNAALPSGFRVLVAYDAGEKLPSLTALLARAEYTIVFEGASDEAKLQSALEALLSGPIVVDKRTKGGVKPTDIRPQVLLAKFGRTDENSVALRLAGVLNASGSLNPDVFVKELLGRAGESADYSIHRDAVFFENGRSVPI